MGGRIGSAALVAGFTLDRNKRSQAALQTNFSQSSQTRRAQISASVVEIIVMRTELLV